MANLIIDAQQRAQGLDLIFFSGYSGDANYLLEALPSPSKFPDLRVMGGDGIYDRESYPTGASGFPANAYNRLFFIASGYSDTWSSLHRTHSCLCEYSLAFDPQTVCPGPQTDSKYYYNRADGNAILAYDAVRTLVHAASLSEQIARKRGDSTFTFDDLNQAFEGMHGNRALQGASGQIAFALNGDPIDKAVVVISADTQEITHLESISGCFLKGKCQPMGAA